MENERELLERDFQEKDFPEKKKVLFGILSKLYPSGATVVTDLWNLVYNLTDETRHDILIEAHNILLDAIYKTQEEELKKSIAQMEENKKAIQEMKWREQQEKVEEMASANMEDMFNFT